MNRMPIGESEIRIDIDIFVWVWNSTEKSWVRTTTWSANALYKIKPDRYTHWLPDCSMRVPE